LYIKLSSRAFLRGNTELASWSINTAIVVFEGKNSSILVGS